MPIDALSHDCDYQSVDAPGQPVVPLIVSGELVRHEAIHRYLERMNTMRPGHLYRCTRCGAYVYVTQACQTLRLREDAAPSGLPLAC